MAKAEPHAVRRFSFTVHSFSAFPAFSAFSSLTARSKDVRPTRKEFCPAHGAPGGQPALSGDHRAVALFVGRILYQPAVWLPAAVALERIGQLPEPPYKGRPFPERTLAHPASGRRGSRDSNSARVCHCVPIVSHQSRSHDSV